MDRVNGLIALLEEGARVQRDGDPVNQRDHALFIAQLAEMNGADDEMIVACLLHDLGTILLAQNGRDADSPDGARLHAVVAAEYLEVRGFPRRVVSLVASHVDSKRYLAATNSDYERRLTRASLRALRAAGGPMHVEEAERFMQRADFNDAMRIRLWDDRAYWPPAEPVPGLDHYRPLLTRLLSPELMPSGQPSAS